MLKSFSVHGFKSLETVQRLEFGPLTVIFGPNAVGKSNLLDALQVYSRLATSNTAADAIATPVRGLPLEIVTFPPGGLPQLIQEAQLADTRGEIAKREFVLGGDIEIDRVQFRYNVSLGIAPMSGAVTVDNELLQRLSRTNAPTGRAIIETDAGRTKIRRKSKPAHPWEEEAGNNHTQLSNRRYSGKEYALLETARNELASFRSYYLDPRVSMRTAQSPQEVDDIGVLGELIAPFLYRLKAEQPKVYESVRRTLRTVIPAIEDLAVELDGRRGVLDIEIRQNGTPFSSRIVSEGTLRVLGLICVAVNPWAGSLVAFEEPENGVHPRRIELVAKIMASLVKRGSRQVILTTHSPVMCGALLRLARDGEADVRFYRAVQQGARSEFFAFDSTGPLFADAEVRNALTTSDEERIFSELQVRGFFDAA
jgi:predicted ATPase